MISMIPKKITTITIITILIVVTFSNPSVSEDTTTTSIIDDDVDNSINISHFMQLWVAGNSEVDAGIEDISWSPLDNEIAYSTYENNITIIDSKSGLLLRKFNFSEKVRTLDWSPNGNEIAYCSPLTGKSQQIKIINATNGEILRAFTDPYNTSYYNVFWSPGGSKIASLSYDNKTTIWDANTGEIIFSFENDLNPSESNMILFDPVSWSPDGKMIACGEYGGAINIWNVDNGSLITKLALNEKYESYDIRYDDYEEAPIFSTAWSPDGSKIACSYAYEWGSDYLKCITIWNKDWEQIKTIGLKPHYDAVGWVDTEPVKIGWSPDGRLIAVYGDDLQIIDYESGEGKYVDSNTRHLQTFDWCPKENLVVSGYMDRTIRLFGIPADISVITSNISFSDNAPKIGENVTVTITLYNYGKVNASNFLVEILCDDIKIDEQIVDFIERDGGKASLQTTFTTTNKKHTIKIIADSEDIIPEFNKDNNLASKGLNVREAISIEDYAYLFILVVLLIIILILFYFYYGRKK